MDPVLLLAARVDIDPALDAGAVPALVRELLARAPDMDWAFAASRVVAHHQRSGHPERSWPLLRLLEPRVAELAERSPLDAALALRALATQALLEGGAEAFVARAGRAARAFEAAGDRAAAAFERAALGHAYRVLGAHDDATREIHAALAAPIAALALHGLAKRDLAAILAARGTVDEARRLSTEAVALLADHPDRRLPGVARVELAAVITQAGDGAGAEEEARRALEGLADHPPGRASAAAVLARALLVKGDPTGARSAAEAALADVEALGGLDEGEALVRLAVVEARRATGDEAGAASALVEARRRVLGVASRLGDPALRRAFLENVPENRRILALAAPAPLR
jgi:tetratricopeptide (TPR) repeat protein